MRENRQSGSEGGGVKPIISPYPYPALARLNYSRELLKVNTDLVVSK